MGKIKVLFISHSAGIAGAEVCLRTLVKHLDRNKFEPVVVFPSMGPLRDDVEKMGVRTHIVKLEWWIRTRRDFVDKGTPLLHRVNALAEIIESERPDVVHSNTSVICEGALAARLCGVPHLWHLHEILDGHPSLNALFPLPVVYWLMGSLSTHVVAVSRAIVTRFEHLIGAEKLSIIPNGSDQQAALPMHQSVREELSLSDDAIVALAVGSLVPEKGYGTMLQALARVRQGGRHVHLVIAGWGAETTVHAFQAQVRALGLRDVVHYLGFRNDIPQLMNQCDLFLLSSLTESFSLVTLDAMAAGKPVIATDCGGPSEIVLNGETGYLVPVNDTAEIAARIIELTDDPSKMLTFGERGRVQFRERYTAMVFAANFQQLYEDLAPLKAASTRENRVLVESLASAYQELYDREQRRLAWRSPHSWPILQPLKKVKRRFGQHRHSSTKVN